MVYQWVIIQPASGINIAHYLFYMNQKQIDNLSKYCYDVSKLILGFAVVGNLLSGKFSLKAFGIGLAITSGLLITGYVLDGKEVEKGDAD